MRADIQRIINTDPEWTTKDETIITEPFNYLNKNKGKQLRTILIQSFNNILHIERDKLDIISNIIELLHTASLLIDDIEDGSNLRRGKPTAHLIYGIPFTINSSNYIYFKSFNELIQLSELCESEFQRSKCIKIFNDELLNLHRGQCMDLYWRDNLIIPTENEYLTMVMNKTGGLFRLAIRLMELFVPGTSSKSLVPLVNLLGMIYQIRDDYLNLRNGELQNNKGFCEDITEGKFSFPIVHALSVNKEDKTLLGILKQRTTDDQLKKFAVNFLAEKGSFDYTVRFLQALKSDAIDIIDQLGDNRELRGIVEQLADV
jgi:geranylgeranyl diphosphate synthase type 3